ncbi:MAG: hypothetical protein VX938_08755, partial [Myxococcota bacterium]|nr:hypothetical protein [Myxococcota bacterium]
LAAYLTDNGFEAGPSFSGLWDDLNGVPDDLMDGDADTLGGLTCQQGQIPRFNADGQWECGQDNDNTLTSDEVGVMAGEQGYASAEDLSTVAFSGSFHHLGNIPDGLLDGDQDTLAALPCVDGQIARRTADGWACAEDAKGVEVAPTPPPCDAAATGSVYYDTTEAKLLVCDGVTNTRIRTCVEHCPEPAAIACGQTTTNDCGDPCAVVGEGLNLTQCDAATVVCGAVVFDACQNPCPQAGVALDPAACVAEDVLCGQPVADACGNSCGLAGTAHDPNQCLDGSVACGQPVSDTCGNPCEVTGTGLNAAECDLGNTPCGESTADTCGNACPGFGQF